MELGSLHLLQDHILVTSLFYRLLDNAIAEVHRREPNYRSLFPISVLPEQMIARYERHPYSGKFAAEVIRGVLTRGFEHINKVWTQSEKVVGVADPIAQFLGDSIIDAFYADQGLLSLEPYSYSGPSVQEILSRAYSERQTAAGVHYYVRTEGTRPLLLINPTGTPVTLWKHFLGDSAHDFKVILPHRRGTNLFSGGLQEDVDVQTESADLALILDSELASQVDVIAWCNGAKVALELVSARSHQISSMVLIGPMLKGVRGVAPAPSAFELNLQPLLNAVMKRPALAPVYSKAISQTTIPDWSRLRDDPVSRAQALFVLPARDHACDMIAPLTDPVSFVNIARRVASDETYPTAEALRNLKTRSMVILGSDDNVVSNALIMAALKHLCDTMVLSVIVQSSGHYVHDLQYHYFRWLLTEFLQNHKRPSASARVFVEEISRSCVGSA